MCRAEGGAHWTLLLLRTLLQVVVVVMVVVVSHARTTVRDWSRRAGGCIEVVHGVVEGQRS